MTINSGQFPWNAPYLYISHEFEKYYPQTSNINWALVGYKIFDHSDVVGESPVVAAPATSSLSTWHLASMDWRQQQTEI